jgi:hypothetical protein
VPAAQVRQVAQAGAEHQEAERRPPEERPARHPVAAPQVELVERAVQPLRAQEP